MLKKYFSNPSIIFLLAGNLYCIWYYEAHPDGFATVVWIYWFQSIIIGLFNFLDLLTVKNFDGAGFTMNDRPVTQKSQGCTALFFLVHYGFFHIGYAVFLLINQDILSVHKMILLIGIATFLLESIINFKRQKEMERTLTVNIGSMFFLPYLRIVPMHLMILIPSFFGVKPSLVFLILKMGADILSFILYHRIYNKNSVAKK